MHLSQPIPVYDIEVDSKFPNFSLGNGIIVHNSKDISDGVCGSVYNLYQHLDVAGQLSNRYIANKGAKMLQDRGKKPSDQFQSMVENLFK